MTKVFNFKSKLWRYTGEAAWQFITLPLDVAEEINFLFGNYKRGWGSLPVKATINTISWKSSIFTDKKSGSFLLPVKADVRKKASIKEGDEVEVEIELSD